MEAEETNVPSDDGSHHSTIKHIDDLWCLISFSYQKSGIFSTSKNRNLVWSFKTTIFQSEALYPLLHGPFVSSCQPQENVKFAIELH